MSNAQLIQKMYLNNTKAYAYYIAFIAIEVLERPWIKNTRPLSLFLASNL